MLPPRVFNLTYMQVPARIGSAAFGERACVLYCHGVMHASPLFCLGQVSKHACRSTGYAPAIVFPIPVAHRLASVVSKAGVFVRTAHSTYFPQTHLLPSFDISSLASLQVQTIHQFVLRLDAYRMTECAR
jgi:hypothetical protein